MPNLAHNIVPVFELTVALRHIIYRKRGTILSVAAIALAVSISLVSIFMMDGFRNMLFDIIIEDLPHVVVSPKEGEEYIYLHHSLTDRIWDMPGVVAVSASLGTGATFTYKENVENVAMSGVNPEDFERIYHIGEYMIQGELISIQSGKKVILGRKLAERLKVKMDQTLYASFPDARETSLVVSGIFDPPMGWPEDLALVSLGTARTFLNQGDVVSSVDIKLKDVYQGDAIARSLRDHGYKADSWQKLYPEILETLAIESFENNLNNAADSIIASFGVGASCTCWSMRDHEIGMLMAMEQEGRDNDHISDRERPAGAWAVRRAQFLDWPSPLPQGPGVLHGGPRRADSHLAGIDQPEELPDDNNNSNSIEHHRRLLSCL